MAGRPAIGGRVEIRLPAELLAQIDQIASDANMTRAETLRALIAIGLTAHN